MWLVKIFCYLSGKFCLIFCEIFVNYIVCFGWYFCKLNGFFIVFEFNCIVLCFCIILNEIRVVKNIVKFCCNDE